LFTFYFGGGVTPKTSPSYIVAALVAVIGVARVVAAGAPVPQGGKIGVIYRGSL